MNIEKISRRKSNCKKTQYYYNAAREGMHDFVKTLFEKHKIDTILLPGYVGISVKEGSGIFDSVNSIKNLKIEYYKMDRQLNIVESDLFGKIKDNRTLVLLVNYFGFRDKNFNIIVSKIKKHGCVVLEDNAHGFFTYFQNENYEVDATIFSLHKMFPFEKGGILLIHNENYKNYLYHGSRLIPENYNPYNYDINRIAQIRRSNYEELYDLLKPYEGTYIEYLRDKDKICDNVPQTFPVIIISGNRDKIYEIMNDSGYGVVSLYHTMIPDLRNDNHKLACELSRRVMNFPVHQDVDTIKYRDMVDVFVKACDRTEREKV